MEKMTIQEASKEMKVLLGLKAVDFMDKIMSVVTKKYSLDIIKLNDYMIENKGYDEEEDGSLSDFILKEYGKDAVDFIKNAI